jgi:hypothetical protein
MTDLIIDELTATELHGLLGRRRIAPGPEGSTNGANPATLASPRARARTEPTSRAVARPVTSATT